MSKTNSYIIKNGNSLNTIANGVSAFLQTSQNMETQVLSSNNGDMIVQGRVVGNNWKRFIGMDKAISVKMSEANGILQVEIGEGKWLDKGLIMTISMFVLWPLAITSGFGFYQQAKIPEKIFDYISNNLL